MNAQMLTLVDTHGMGQEKGLQVLGGVKDPTEHLTVECDKYKDQRSQLLTEVISITEKRNSIGSQKMDGSPQYWGYMEIKLSQEKL